MNMWVNEWIHVWVGSEYMCEWGMNTCVMRNEYVCEWGKNTCESEEWIHVSVSEWWLCYVDHLVYTLSLSHRSYVFQNKFCSLGQYAFVSYFCPGKVKVSIDGAWTGPWNILWSYVYSIHKAHSPKVLTPLYSLLSTKLCGLSYY